MKKVKVRCYKCGNEFEVNEGVRSDICPACMSFVDISRAREAYGQAADTQSSEKEVRPGETEEVPAESPAAKPQTRTGEYVPKEEIAPSEEPLQAEQTVPEEGTAPAESDGLVQAEKLLEAGIWNAAREKFLQVLEERDCWQAHWGIVCAATRQLTDFSGFSAVRDHVEEAFSQMPAQERHRLGERFVSQLSELRRRTVQAIKATEKALPPLQESQYRKKKSVLFFAGGIVFFVFLFVAVTLLGNSGGNAGLSAAGGLFIIFDLAVLLFLIGFAIRRFWQEYRDKQALQAVEDSKREQHESEVKKLRERLDSIDILCGYLKY